MPISITSVVRVNGPACNHITITVDDEGQSRSFESSFPELDALIDQLGGPLAAKKALVLLWAAYRRSQARVVVGVNIA